MDIVYVVKRAADNGDELRYSLRSLRNIDHDNVWIVGQNYPWTKSVRFLETNQAKNSWANVHNSLRRVCLEQELSDDFIFFNDDFYVMQKFEEMPTLHGGPFDDLKNRYGSGESHYYARIVRNTSAYLKDNAKNYDLHVPIVLNKNLLPGVIDDSADRLFRSIYGNRYSVGGEYYKDTKVRSKKHPAPARTPEEIMASPFVSTSNASFWKSFVGDYIRESFLNKSDYEL